MASLWPCLSLCLPSLQRCNRCSRYPQPWSRTCSPRGSQGHDTRVSPPGGARKQYHSGWLGAQVTSLLSHSVPWYLMGVGAQRHPEGSSQSKVSQLDGPQLIDEQILGLQVSMDDPMRVAEAHPLQQLEEVTLEQWARERSWQSGGGVGADLLVKQRPPCWSARPSPGTLTRCRGSSEAGVESMYFFRSWLRNSNTR